MKWAQPLEEAVLKKRYKRFLADVHLGQEFLTVHVPNTGSMTSCWEPDWKCALSRSDNPSRKMPYTLELVWNGETWIGVNTANANKLASTWLKQNLIPELAHYPTITPEKKVGDSRIDFFLSGHQTFPDTYVEVKNVTLKLEGIAQFPDSVSERGQKHLRELMLLKKQGFRSVMLFVVQREDVETFRPAVSIDPEYARLLKLAQEKGVEVLCYQARLNLSELSFHKALPINL